MHAAVRSRLNMGIAMAGASAIALAPIAQPMPAIAELQARVVSSAEVALSAAANPIEQWAQIIQDALANGGALVQSYLNNPLPIVHQLILNGAGYVGQTVTALQTSFSNLVDTLRFDNPYGFPAGVQQGLSQILSGQIYEGYNTLFNAGLGLIIGPVFPLLELLEIPVTMAQNFANVVAALPMSMVGLGLGAIGTINGTLQATAFQVQAVFDALKTGNLLGAVGAIVATPGAIVNAVLNGFALSGAPGLLSPGGLIDQVMQALNGFAQAIAPTTPIALSARVAETGPAALPSAALSVATATLGAEKVAASTEATKAAETEPVAAEPTVTEPAATEPVETTPDATTEPAATEPAAAAPETPSTATETKPETKPESGSAAGSTKPANGATDTTDGNKAEPGKTGEPTKPSGSSGSETGSGSTTGSESAGSEGAGSGASGSGSGASGSGASGSGASGSGSASGATA